MRHPFRSVVLAVSLAALIGCGSSSKPEPQAAEIVPKGHSNSVKGSADDIFHNAKHLYYSGLYSVARENFETLRDSYAPGPYAEFGAIKAADAAFESGEFDQAAQAYEEFTSNYPSSKSRPYAMLRAGRSHQLSQKGLGRDPAGLEKARDSYQKLIEAYPGSTYADAARRYRAEVVENLGAYEKLVMEFYQENSKQRAAAARTASYENKWQPLIAQAAAQVPPSDAPSAPVVVASADLGTRSFPILAAQRLGSVRARITRAPSEAAAGPRMEEITCSGNIVTVRLSASAPRDLDGRTMQPESGRLSLGLNGIAADPATQNCFGKSDLRIASGRLQLASNRPAKLLTVENPARLLLILQ